MEFQSSTNVFLAIFINIDNGIYWVIQSFLQGTIFNYSFCEIYLNYGKIPKIYPFTVKNIREQSYFDLWFDSLIADSVEKEKNFKYTVNTVIKNEIKK